MTPHEYAETIAPIALQLPAAVRSGDPHAVTKTLTNINNIPAPAGINPSHAVAVILAAAVPPNRTTAELLDWTTTLPEPAPAKPPRRTYKPRACAVTDCPRPRTRGSLCYRCTREHAHEIHPCHHPRCTNSVWQADYCGNHDHGIDWAAGDWYDHVAVDRIWTGHPTHGRLPTEPEVRELIARADRDGIPYNELANRLGITHHTLARWRNTLTKIDTEAAA
jgi:hypothetical protein